jgi:hypothetical protein
VADFSFSSLVFSILQGNVCRIKHNNIKNKKKYYKYMDKFVKLNINGNVLRVTKYLRR